MCVCCVILTFASILGTDDIVKKVKKVIKNVLVSKFAGLTSLDTSLSDLANQLYADHLISNEVQKACSMQKFIEEFQASLCFKEELPEIQEHCEKFLASFIAVRGSYAAAAIALHKAWTKAVRTELGLDFKINIDT